MVQSTSAASADPVSTTMSTSQPAISSGAGAGAIIGGDASSGAEAGAGAALGATASSRACGVRACGRDKESGERCAVGWMLWVLTTAAGVQQLVRSRRIQAWPAPPPARARAPQECPHPARRPRAFWAHIRTCANASCVQTRRSSVTPATRREIMAAYPCGARPGADQGEERGQAAGACWTPERRGGGVYASGAARLGEGRTAVQWVTVRL